MGLKKLGCDEKIELMCRRCENHCEQSQRGQVAHVHVESALEQPARTGSLSGRKHWKVNDACKARLVHFVLILPGQESRRFRGRDIMSAQQGLAVPCSPLSALHRATDRTTIPQFQTWSHRAPWAEPGKGCG